MIAKIGIIAFVIVAGVWFFYTNDQFLKEKEAEKTLLVVPEEIEEPEMITEVEEPEPVVEEVKPAPRESGGEKMDSIECMQRASKIAQGDIDEYRKALEECQ